MSYVLKILFHSILVVNDKSKTMKNFLMGKRRKKKRGKKKSALQEIRNTWFNGRSRPEHSFE